MRTPFDAILDNIKGKGFHNHRNASHSDLMTEKIFLDLRNSCEKLAGDLGSGVVCEWRAETGPDKRNTDLIIGVAKNDGKPDLTQVRILVEHKSIVTAHRNRDARFQDIERVILATHAKNPLAIVVATLMVGVCEKVLNVPDGVKSTAKARGLDFDAEVLPRLRSNDQTLWQDFPNNVSSNKNDDPEKTVEKFRRLPVRGIADTYYPGLDFLLIIPAEIDNVNPPRLSRIGNIDPVADYNVMIRHICEAYKVRWP